MYDVLPQWGHFKLFIGFCNALDWYVVKCEPKIMHGSPSVSPCAWCFTEWNKSFFSSIFVTWVWMTLSFRYQKPFLFVHSKGFFDLDFPLVWSCTVSKCGSYMDICYLFENLVMLTCSFGQFAWTLHQNGFLLWRKLDFEVKNHYWPC